MDASVIRKGPTKSGEIYAEIQHFFGPNCWGILHMAFENSHFVWAIGILIGLLLIGFAYYHFAKKPLGPPPSPEELQTVPRESSYTAIPYVETAPFSSRSRRLHDQNENWKECMRQHGRQLKENRVGAIFFVHGTFVGIDPFSFARGIQNAFPDINKRIKLFVRNTSFRKFTSS
jgi:hypothetical protein